MFDCVSKPGRRHASDQRKKHRLSEWEWINMWTITSIIHGWYGMSMFAVRCVCGYYYLPFEVHFSSVPNENESPNLCVHTYHYIAICIVILRSSRQKRNAKRCVILPKDNDECLLGSKRKWEMRIMLHQHFDRRRHRVCNSFGELGARSSWFMLYAAQNCSVYLHLLIWITVRTHFFL